MNLDSMGPDDLIGLNYSLANSQSSFLNILLYLRVRTFVVRFEGS